ncbi:MAG TPA: SDR family NAD(P)-dependent oxidoreductase [Solirubrobacterales bacterium]|jgi:NAD(P)-dependent dehydrogenase (short-subunit alcohol dehydrogenase family)|nr:SDR family NAD(P)-dependent oxidoreductase [Solirubrobacterales bacterium]
MNVQGAGALVAGGASGLGAATARALAKAGAQVVIADRDAELGAELATEIGASFAAVDVTDASAVAAAVEQAATAPEGLRISVCCAGIGWAERLARSRGAHDLDHFSKVINVNLIGTFNVMRIAAAVMIENEPDAGEERGVCINTASIAAFEGQIGQVAYSASKGAIVAMTLPAARDLASRGVRVMTIAPGTFDTRLLEGLPEAARLSLGAEVPFPKRLGVPAEYALLVEQIVANPMLNGETIRLDGALRMKPK